VTLQSLVTTYCHCMQAPRICLFLFYFTYPFFFYHPIFSHVSCRSRLTLVFKKDDAEECQVFEVNKKLPHRRKLWILAGTVVCERVLKGSSPLGTVQWTLKAAGDRDQPKIAHKRLYLLNTRKSWVCKNCDEAFAAVKDLSNHNWYAPASLPSHH